MSRTMQLRAPGLLISDAIWQALRDVREANWRARGVYTPTWTRIMVSIDCWDALRQDLIGCDAFRINRGEDIDLDQLGSLFGVPIYPSENVLPKGWRLEP